HLFDKLLRVPISHKALGLVVVWNIGTDTRAKGNVWYCIFFGIVFISLLSIGLGGFKGIDRNVHFVEEEKFSISLIVMLCIPLYILWVTTVVECRSVKEAHVVAVDFTGLAVAIQGINTAIFHNVVRQTLTCHFRFKSTFAISGFSLPDSVNGGQKDLSANISQAYFPETFPTVSRVTFGPVCNHEFISNSVNEKSSTLIRA
ncbi:unnamed protein product, partial [Porites evermanni]